MSERAGSPPIATGATPVVVEDARQLDNAIPTVALRAVAPDSLDRLVGHVLALRVARHALRPTLPLVTSPEESARAR